MRIRSIKPEFWRSDDITALSVEARLVFIGLWSYVDDNGVGIDSEKIITAELFANEDDLSTWRTVVAGALSECSLRALVTRYTVSGKAYIHVTNWEKHQKINRPSSPRYPGPELAEAPVIAALQPVITEPSVSPHGALQTSSVLEQGNRGTGEQGKEPLAPLRAASEPTPLRPRNELWDAVVEVCGIEDKTTKTQATLIGKVCRELADVDATPNQIKVRANRYRQRYRDADLTPSALVKHWASLGDAQAPAAARPQDLYAALSRPRSQP